MKKIYKILAIMFICFSSSLFSQTNITALSNYFVFENAIYTENLTEAEADILFDKAVSSILYLDPPELRYAYLARTYFYRGLLSSLVYMKNCDESIWLSKDHASLLKVMVDIKDIMYAYTLTAQEFSQKSLAIKQTPDGLVTNAVLRFLNVSSKSPLTMIFAWFSFTSSIKKALKLNPNHLNAQMMSAAINVMPPARFGNVKKGIEELKKITAEQYPLAPPSDFYLINLLMTQAYMQSDNIDEAEKWLLEAKKYYNGTPIKIYSLKIAEKRSAS